MLENVEDVLERYLEERLTRLAVQSLCTVQPVEAAVYTLRGKQLWCSCAGNVELPADASADAVWTQALAEGQERNRGLCIQGLTQPVYLSPITILEGAIGFLAALPASCPPDSDRLLTALEVCGGFLGEALVGRRTGADLAAELTERYEELSLVYTLTEAMDISKSEKEAIGIIAGAVAQTLGADLLILLVPRLEYEYFYPESHDPSWHPLAHALFANLNETRRTTAINHLENNPELAKIAAPYSHVACVPLEVDTDLGMLALLRKDPEDRLFMGQVKMLEAVSRQLSIFLTNHKIISARKQLFDLTIFGLARLAESRDVETGEHLERVSSYCRLLSEYCLKNNTYPEQMTEAFVETIFSSSPLHDIGKVGIPDAILNKPGKLTPEEFDLMKLHSVIGGDTLRDIENRLNWGESTFLTMGREIAYSHHEKWDGSGYPQGLSEEKIPLSGRIMAVADVYDALTSKRCYKEAMPHERAKEIIVQGRGQHFDPRLVDAFLLLEQQFMDISDYFHGPGGENRERERFLQYFNVTKPEIVQS